jgi:hypothetical protein
MRGKNNIELRALVVAQLSQLIRLFARERPDGQAKQIVVRRAVFLLILLFKLILVFLT